ncbi:MAG: cytochrome P450 [Hyphomonadaceae bacterium]
MGADGEGQAPRILMFQFSELNPEMRRDPHALLDPQRAAAPAERDAFVHAVLITSYDLGRDLLTDPAYSRNFDLASPDNPVIAGVKKLNDAVEAEFGRHATMLTMEDPDHARVRSIVAKAFLARAAKARPLIEGVVSRALAALEGRDRFDVVADYACRIPIHVLGPILGCAEDALDDLRRWTEAGQTAFDPTKFGQDSSAAIEGRRGILRYFSALIDERRAQPGDDLVTDLLQAQADGAPIDDGEILHNMFALLVAGHLTTADLIGNGVALLLTHPEARAQIEADPALIAPAVDEVLRYEPPIATTARFVGEAGQIGKCPYHGGDALAVSLLSANRDPAAFADPHRFDIARRPNPHLAFGAGAHMCVGAPLARAEGQEAILRLLQRFPHLRRAEEGPLEWRAVAGVRGLERLEVLIS